MTQYAHPDLPGFISPAPFKLGEGDQAISYARGWWQKASEQEIAALGFVEYVPPEPEPATTEQTIEGFRSAIQDHVDTQARSRRYDSGNSLATYVTSTVVEWAAEAVAFVCWRDAVWDYAYAEMDKVLSGQREQPTVQEFLDELPVIVWPEDGE